jgi:cellulose biosynthesis protein BcsQ
MKSIVIFNNKGGVGKTTFLCNLGAYLQQFMNLRVVIVDADPQSNATTYALSEDQILDLYSRNTDQGTLNDIFRTLRKTGNFYEKEIPLIKSPRFGFDILPGNPSISLFEDFLSRDWFDATNGESRGLRTTMIFHSLNRRLEADYDIVLYDIGPSLGAINRSVLLACDFFVLPMSSDIFSLKAVENIKISLDSWKNSFNEGLDKYSSREEEAFTINETEITFHLQFAGYITQQYLAKKNRDGKKEAVKAFDKIIKNIPSSITTHLSKFSSASSVDLKLGEIPNLHSLIPLSQSSHAPIFALNAQDGVVGAHFSKVKDYEQTIKGVSTNILRNIQASL